MSTSAHVTAPAPVSPCGRLRRHARVPGPQGRYWRCPVRRVWAGPCGGRRAARRAATDHRQDRPPATSGRKARTAARRVRQEMTAAAALGCPGCLEDRMAARASRR